jgi:hypothetical protein
VEERLFQWVGEKMSVGEHEMRQGAVLVTVYYILACHRERTTS